MKQRSLPHRLSRPVALVATAALALGLLGLLGSVGSATAGSPLGKITAAKVRKIAATVVTRKARTLTVARAKNADRLGGKAPSAYLDRASYAASNDQVALPPSTTNSILGPLSITVPDGVGLVRIDGAATFTGAAGGFGVYYALDGPCSTAVALAEASYSNTDDGQDSAGFSVLKEASPGVHEVRLCANNAGMNVNQRHILVQTVAGGPTGGPIGGPALGLSAPDSARPTRPGVAAR